MTRLVRCIALAAPLIAVLVAFPASADPVEDFYRGKQIRIVIRAAPGGNYDLYSRLLARHIVRFIPGHPTVIPVNMPGGSGLTALNYVSDVHPRDGTVLTMVTQTFPLEQALALNDKLKTDMRALNWIGNMSDATSFLLTARASATRTIEDAKRRETIIGVPSLADASAWLTLVTNGTLGTRFKLVPGYTSGPNMNLAMERGEIDGRGRKGCSRAEASAAPTGGRCSISLCNGASSRTRTIRRRRFSVHWPPALSRRWCSISSAGSRRWRARSQPTRTCRPSASRRCDAPSTPP
jgi:hypothetical protein